MKNDIEKLHTAIRRYCLNRYDYWMKTYSELNAQGKGFSLDSGYSNESLVTIPRYHVLNAILIEIERHRPTDFSQFNEARDFFVLAVKEAQSIFTEPPKAEIEIEVMNQERERLQQYIAQLTEKDLIEVEPLFYRRVLSKAESDDIREKLKIIWNVNGYWYPLDNKIREDVEAFQDSYFESEFGFEKLQKVLCRYEIDKI